MSVITCFAVVFLAELGDKTQILSMIMVSKYGARQVLLGTAVGAAAVSFVSVCFGVGTLAVLPAWAFQVCSGTLFVAVGIAWLYANEDRGLEQPPEAPGDGTLLGIALGFFLAELGDKTMFAGMSLTSQFHPGTVWLGATLALICSQLLAAIGGTLFQRTLGLQLLRALGALCFIGFGVFTLLTAFLPYPFHWPH
ncbi:MAG: TMEM165/GDT1 family protein [Bacillota bacterium]